jgi:hypothetical protein
MVNTLLPRDLLGSKRRALMTVGAIITGLGVFGVIALGLTLTPESQTLSAPSSAIDQSETALFESPTFADRFGAEVKDLPPTIGVSGSVSDDPRAAPLAAYAAVVEARSRASAAAEGPDLIPPGQPPSQTTGVRP